MTFSSSEQCEPQYTSLSAAMRADHIYCVYNEQGRLVFLSPTVRDLLGYSVEEFKRSHWAYTVEDYMNDEAEKYLGQSLEGQTAPPHHMLFEHKNGNRILMEARHWPVYDANGKISRIEGFLRDISADW